MPSFVSMHKGKTAYSIITLAYAEIADIVNVAGFLKEIRVPYVQIPRHGAAINVGGVVQLTVVAESSDILRRGDKE